MERQMNKYERQQLTCFFLLVAPRSSAPFGLGIYALGTARPPVRHDGRKSRGREEV